jgi:hypothetical protein
MVVDDAVVMRKMITEVLSRDPQLEVIGTVFPDSLLGLLLYATVQRNEAIDGGYQIGIEFFKMPESCRTLLARFILEAQARERQRQLNVDD